MKVEEVILNFSKVTAEMGIERWGKKALSKC